MSELQAEQLTLTYGNAAVALSNVSVTVPAGGIVAVLGANGAGKTSLVRALTGQHRFYGATRSGSIRFDGRDLTAETAGAIVGAGVVQVPEGRKLFPSLSVRENLLTGASALSRQSAREVEDRIADALQTFPKLRELIDRAAGYLSGGEQQMVAIGRALMARPKVLICDELSLGLAPLVIRDIYLTLERLNRERGMSLVIIEQNARQALRMASYAYVLEVGQVSFQGDTAKMRTSRDVDKYYLGGH